MDDPSREADSAPETSDGPALEVDALTGGRTADASDAAPPELDRARSVSRLLDSAVRVPGTDVRVGLDPVLGVLPVGGDAVAAALSLYVVAQGVRLGVSARTVAVMLAAVAVDLVIGSVPVLGPFFDAFWRANEWNVSLIESQVEGA